MQDSNKVSTKTIQWALDKGKGQKVQFILQQAMKAHSEWRYNSTLSVTLDGVSGQAAPQPL